MNGSVAALVPVVVLMAVRLRREPSQLLLPLAFSAHAGSLLVLTGSPVNVVVSEAADEAGVGRFGFFEFALVGIPLLAGTIAITLLAGERLLPHRSPLSMPFDFSAHARTLVHQYGLDDISAWAASVARVTATNSGIDTIPIRSNARIQAGRPRITFGVPTMANNIARNKSAAFAIVSSA